MDLRVIVDGKRAELDSVPPQGRGSGTRLDASSSCSHLRAVRSRAAFGSRRRPTWS
jgi:hypothetical protein